MRPFVLLILFISPLFGAAKVDTICAVLVSDHRYYQEFKRTYKELREEGQYRGDVALIITGELSKERVLEDFPDENIVIYEFPKIEVQKSHAVLALAPEKIEAQMQKLHVFQAVFKKWEYIFYLDAGMHIHGDIQRLINCRKKGRLVAHSDCYPDYEWDQRLEFTDNGSESFQELVDRFDLAVDYFQSGMMLIDTDLIDEETVENLIALKDRYPFGRGDQSYISLYFCHIKPSWSLISLGDAKGFIYDICPRGPYRYVMHKCERALQPCVFCNEE